MSAPALELRAGPAALSRIQRDGLSPSMISHIGAAAGGPKWLVLGHLDRWMVSEWFTDMQHPVIAAGSSAGIWRLASLAQRDPVAAIDRFEAAYIDQHYDAKPDAAEVSRQGARILDALLADDAADAIANHPWLKLNIVVARARRGLGSTNALVQAPMLGAAALANLANRRALGWFMERVLIHAPGHPLQLQADGFKTHHTPITAANLRPALMASASIPRVMEPVPEIDGAPGGPYIDGGMIDYHMDLPIDEPSGLLLISHFARRVTPGWLDKFLPWRTARHLDNAVVISPSAEFLAGLPDGRIPDRHDFIRYAQRDEARIKMWRRCVDDSRRIADEFAELATSGRIAERVQPLD